MNEFIEYVMNLEDKDHPQVRWSVLGDPYTNNLHIRVCNNETGVKFEEVITAAVLHPPMCDRIFGIDIDDHNKALVHAEIMWEKYKEQLLV